MLSQKNGKRRLSAGKALIIVMIFGAAAFGLYLGYVEWSTDSFPVQQQPFTTYAQLVYSQFNGTDYSFGVRWLNASYVPLYAQVTSDTDAGNSPVCSLGFSSVQQGQVFYMPFGISPASPELQNVQLWIAVKSVATNSQFTIMYEAGTVSAANGNVVPAHMACAEPPGAD